MPERTKPIKIFYSYSHKDAELRERLGTYLAPLRQRNVIIEWHDRKPEPGADWDAEISTQLDSADLILLLVSADFLASDYCFGVEIEKALTRLKQGATKVVPVLLKPCLWEESRFQNLQIIPRDARAITSWSSVEEAFKDVANEIRNLVSQPPPSPPAAASEDRESSRFASSLELVRDQVRSYARSYEKTRQRMRPSDDRTHRMEQIFVNMRALATASYPLLDELANSPSPGERLAAVAILQVFSNKEALPFLVGLIRSEKPFIGYHATKALRFAVASLDSSVYPRLMAAIHEAQTAVQSAHVGFNADRQRELRSAEQELQATMDSLSAPSAGYD
jgi:hypothetical protein